MTDPLIVKGNIFSNKGSQNHIISKMWSDNVKKELRMQRTWHSKLLQKTEVKSEPIPLPSQTAVASVHIETNVPRKDLLQALRKQRELSQRRLLSPQRTSSADVGFLAQDRSNCVSALDRNTNSEHYGRKPIVQSSFFRRSGVF